MKSKKFEIEIDIYRRSVLVCINDTDEAIKQTLINSDYNKEESIKASKQPDGCQAYAYIFKNRNVLIRITKDTIDPQFHDMVSHEIFHASAAILDYMGIKLGSKSEEAYAYLIGYITRRFYENLLDI